MTSYKPFYLQDRYELTIKFNSGCTIRLNNIAEESYSYLKKWLNGQWPDKEYKVTDANGTDMLLCNPQHIETIIERKLKREPDQGI